jgi:hypothetical protein
MDDPQQRAKLANLLNEMKIKHNTSRFDKYLVMDTPYYSFGIKGSNESYFVISKSGNFYCNGIGYKIIEPDTQIIWEALNAMWTSVE